MVQKLHKIFSKSLLAVFALGLLTISQSFADELLPIYDPAVHGVDSITVIVNLRTTGWQGYEGDMKSRLEDKIIDYLKIGLSSSDSEVKVQTGDYPLGVCRISEEKDHISWQKLEKNNQLFLGIIVGKDINHSYSAEAKPCFETIGQTRLLFPEDWSHIDSNAPIRAGDCFPKYPKGYFETYQQEQMKVFRNLDLIDWEYNPDLFVNFILCNVRPDLDVIIYGIKHAKGNM